MQLLCDDINLCVSNPAHAFAILQMHLKPLWQHQNNLVKIYTEAVVVVTVVAVVAVVAVVVAVVTAIVVVVVFVSVVVCLVLM